MANERVLPIAILLLLSPVLGSESVAQGQQDLALADLDAERRRPPALELHRDHYAHGGFLEASLGVRGFVGGIESLSLPGPMLQISGGYEAQRWLWVGAVFEAALLPTDVAGPPNDDFFETYDLLLELRLQANAGARVGLWLGGSFGVGWVRSALLHTYGVTGLDDPTMVYGSQGGFDWHFRNRHASFGALGGFRIFHSLTTQSDEISWGVHGALYFRHVF